MVIVHMNIGVKLRYFGLEIKIKRFLKEFIQESVLQERNLLQKVFSYLESPQDSAMKKVYSETPMSIFACVPQGPLGRSHTQTGPLWVGSIKLSCEFSRAGESSRDPECHSHGLETCHPR